VAFPQRSRLTYPTPAGGTKLRNGPGKGGCAWSRGCRPTTTSVGLQPSICSWRQHGHSTPPSTSSRLHALPSPATTICAWSPLSLALYALSLAFNGRREREKGTTKHQQWLHLEREDALGLAVVGHHFAVHHERFHALLDHLQNHSNHLNYLFQRFTYL